MKKISLEDARQAFLEKELALHRAINISIAARGTPAFEQACKHLQHCMTSYTDITRIWGALEGAQASQQLYETELSNYETAPMQEEMH